MTPEIVTAFLVGIAGLILAITKLISKVGDVLKRTDEIHDRTDEIHDLTNGAASYARAELRALRDKVDSLHKQLADSKHEAEDARAELREKGD